MKKTEKKREHEADVPFWENTPLSRMTRKQWESLCDGCGLCCMEKLEDADTGVIYVTSVACRYLDLESCRCRIYENRTYINDVCVELMPGSGTLPLAAGNLRLSKGPGRQASSFLAPPYLRECKADEESRCHGQ